MRRRVLGLIAMLAGCLDPDLVECPNDTLCPSGTACDLAHGGCVDPQQLADCEGVAEFSACTAVTDGRCFDGVCLTGGCGNTFVEPEELCDDGNNFSGDGCADVPDVAMHRRAALRRRHVQHDLDRPALPG
jgi:cysteine-rich repeat protein